jgi:hypothetical protein
MIELLPEQIEALRQLKRAYQEARVDAVIYWRDGLPRVD